MSREPTEWDELAELAAALEPAQRAQVAEAWTTAARYEHASIASFDRFALQLLAIGAPPSLLQGAHRAALDEIEHARLSFRVASTYAGRPLGPGPLPLDAASFTDFSWQQTLRETVQEGCVGETLAAAHAELIAEHVQGRALGSIFAIIQRGEAAHAALAFQLASWALGARGDEARAIIETTFDESMAKLHAATPAGSSEPWLWRHGQLNPFDRHAASVRAAREVLAPARCTLLGSR